MMSLFCKFNSILSLTGPKDDYAPAKAAFCPAVEALPPTPSPAITAVETNAPTPPPAETTESLTVTEVVETTSSSSVTTSDAAVATTESAASKSSKDSSMSYAGKATKLFKESKASKAFSTPMSTDSIAPKSGKVMSIPINDAKAGKEMSMKEAKTDKLYGAKASQMSVP